MFRSIFQFVQILALAGILIGCVGPETFVTSGTITDADGNDLSSGGAVLTPMELTYQVTVLRSEPPEEEGGQNTVDPAAGEQVTFTFDDTTGGTVAAPIVITDQNGSARVTIVSGATEGTVSATAQTENGKSPWSFTSVDVFAESQLISVSATVADDNLSATVSATLIDLDGAPVASEVVTFSVVSSPNDGATIAPSATTDGSGVAEAAMVLTAGMSGNVIVKAGSARSRARTYSFAVPVATEE